jgi:hypothetical protein
MKRRFGKLLRCHQCDHRIEWVGKVHTHRHCGARMYVADYLRLEE